MGAFFCAFFGVAYPKKLSNAQSLNVGERFNNQSHHFIKIITFYYEQGRFYHYFMV